MCLPKSLTKVTPLSKLIALALVIALPFIGFYAGVNYQASVSGMVNVWVPRSAAASVTVTPRPVPVLKKTLSK